MIKSAVSIRPLVQALGPSHADPDNGPADVGTDLQTSSNYRNGV